MSHSPECPCGRPRAGCEYHDPALQAPPAEPTAAPQGACRSPAHFRLLGPDDPEVSDDLIYLDEATGGVVGVPRPEPRQRPLSYNHVAVHVACPRTFGRGAR